MRGVALSRNTSALSYAVRHVAFAGVASSFACQKFFERHFYMREAHHDFGVALRGRIVVGAHRDFFL